MSATLEGVLLRRVGRIEQSLMDGRSWTIAALLKPSTEDLHSRDGSVAGPW